MMVGFERESGVLRAARRRATGATVLGLVGIVVAAGCSSGPAAPMGSGSAARSGAAPASSGSAPPSASTNAPGSASSASASSASASSASASSAAASSAASTASGSSPIVAVSLGHERGCALRKDGHVVCWGSCSGAGMCGDATPPEGPTAVAGLADATALSASDSGGCALRRDGSIACWKNDLVARAVPGIGGATAVSDDCALVANGKVMCDFTAPREVVGLTGVKALGNAGGGRCAVLGDGKIQCWGEGMYPYLDAPPGTSPTPRAIRTVQGADEVGSGSFFGVCARVSGRVSCWGGEMHQAEPVRRIAGVADAVELAVTEYHACARTASGTVACWGANGSGQLGLPTTTVEDDAAHVVRGVSDAVGIAVGGGEPCGGCGTSCAVTKRGELYCWGGIPSSERPKAIDLTLK